MSRAEIITALTCLLMVLGWVVGDPLGIDKTIVAFAGLAQC